ncbi:1754_t:CDS:1 [Racocetra fulgida]|uniref:1754_t:CDS:1 n=1 Tax=Racocetra fulgida TaxID=60492 RepID=A0A9N9F691_9GLOM|nr:1754_t:CDS:1 [Racocetra fulgida]
MSDSGSLEQENAHLKEQLHNYIQENIQLKKFLEKERNINRCLNKQAIELAYVYKKKLQNDKARLQLNYQSRINENNMYLKQCCENLQKSEKEKNKMKDAQLKAMRIFLSNR